MLRTLTLVLLVSLALFVIWIFPWSQARHLDFDNPLFYATEVTGGIPEEVETARGHFFARPLDPRTEQGLDMLSEDARKQLFSMCEDTLEPIRIRTGATYVAVSYQCEIEGLTIELEVCRYLAWGPFLPHIETPYDVAGRKLSVRIPAHDGPVEDLPWGCQPDCEQ